MKRFLRILVWFCRTRTRLGWALVGGICLGMFFSGAVARRVEPRVEGKPLRFWLGELEGESAESQAALRGFGEGPVSFLMARLDTNRAVVPRWARYMPERWQPHEYFIAVDERKRGEALMGLQALGPQARAALPEMYSRIEDRRYGTYFMSVIPKVEGNPEKMLMRVRGKNSRTVSWALGELGTNEWGPRTREYVRGLLNDADSSLKWAATEAFLRQPITVEERQQLLAKALGDPNARVRRFVLSRFERNPTEMYLVLGQVHSLTNDRVMRIPALKALAAGKIVSRQYVWGEVQKEMEEQQRQWQERQRTMKRVGGR